MFDNVLKYLCVQRCYAASSIVEHCQHCRKITTHKKGHKNIQTTFL
mgnify:CR=1 FL=1